MLELTLHNPRQHKQFRSLSGSLMLARANQDLALWTAVDRNSDCPHPRIEIVPQSDGVLLTLAECEAECDCGRTCNGTGGCRLLLPACFTIGDTRFEIVAETNAPSRAMQGLHRDKSEWDNHPSSAAGPSPETLSRWFAALGSLNHWATSLQELYIEAARCAVEAIGLDGGIVLRRRENEWEIAASHLPHPELGIHYDVAALNELLIRPQTLFHGASNVEASDEPAIAISPLRNAAGELAGAVYGYRSVRRGNSRRTIRYLEAHMIELLAGAVSEGIARIEHEAETVRSRVVWEQLATVSHGHTSDEISTEEREVTMLFADLRESTALTVQLDPNLIYELLSQVMECLTSAVIDHDGLIIDYYGDGLAAIWNAPADQSDHAELACRAGLRMLQSLAGISSDWNDILQTQLQLGIGIHTGMTHVGNTGSRRRAKYGPRGTNVHLTSRIESATKQLGIPLLVSEATAKRLSNRLGQLRVCRAHLLGFDGAIELYSVCQLSGNPRILAAWQAYSEALRLFESGQFKQALDILGTVDTQICEIPSRFLLEHAQRELSRTHRRRSTDGIKMDSAGVIILAARDK